MQDAWCCGDRGRSDCGRRIPGQRCHPCGLPPPSCSQVAGHGYVHYMALHSRRMCKGDHVVRSEHADQTAEALHIQRHMFHIILSPCGVWPSAVCMRSTPSRAQLQKLSLLPQACHSLSWHAACKVLCTFCDSALPSLHRSSIHISSI